VLVRRTLIKTNDIMKRDPYKSPLYKRSWSVRLAIIYEAGWSVHADFRDYTQDLIFFVITCNIEYGFLGIPIRITMYGMAWKRAWLTRNKKTLKNSAVIAVYEKKLVRGFLNLVHDPLSILHLRKFTNLKKVLI